MEKMKLLATPAVLLLALSAHRAHGDTPAVTADEPPAFQHALSATNDGYRSLRLGNGRTIKLPIYKLTEEDKANILQADTLASQDNGLAQYAEFSASDLQSLRGIMSPVKDQGSRGTCNVFAAVALMESRGTGIFSEQCLAFQSSTEDGGFVRQRVEWAAANHLYSAADCPYDSKTRDKLPPNLAVLPQLHAPGHFTTEEGSLVRALPVIKDRINRGSPVGISIWVAGGQWADESFFPAGSKCADYFSGPDVQTCQQINDEFSFLKRRAEVKELMKRSWVNQAYKAAAAKQSYAGYDPIDAPSDQEILATCHESAPAAVSAADEDLGPIAKLKHCAGHAIVITGYDDATQTLEFKNSWGTDWGARGYGYLTYAYFLKLGKASGLNAMVVYDNH